MTSQKMVDGDLLSKLLEGSYEAMISRVDEAVLAHADLFGGSDKVDVRAVGTYPSHVIVVNSGGDFFRAVYNVVEDANTVSLGEVERVQIPVKEASELSVEAREKAEQAVEAIMSGDDDAASKAVFDLYGMVRSGVRLTAESVEDAVKRLFAEDADWSVAIHDNEKAIQDFVGSEANRDLPKPRFVHIDVFEDEERHRKVIGGALKRLKESLATLHVGMSLAREIDESYSQPAYGNADGAMAMADFIAFVESFDSDLSTMKGLIEDAVAVSADGDLVTLARIHDDVADRMHEVGLAAAFCEKFARRFNAPKAA